MANERLIHRLSYTSVYTGTGVNEFEWTEKQEIAKAQFLATGETCKAIALPNCNFNKKIKKVLDTQQMGLWVS